MCFIPIIGFSMPSWKEPFHHIKQAFCKQKGQLMYFISIFGQIEDCVCSTNSNEGRWYVCGLPARWANFLMFSLNASRVSRSMVVRGRKHNTTSSWGNRGRKDFLQRLLATIKGPRSVQVAFCEKKEHILYFSHNISKSKIFHDSFCSLKCTL